MAATEVAPVAPALSLTVFAEESMDVCIKKKLEMTSGILTVVLLRLRLSRKLQLIWRMPSFKLCQLRPSNHWWKQ